MPVRPDLHALLYVDEAIERHANLRARDPLRIYARNAGLLARSAAASGHALTLITNAPERVQALLAEDGLDHCLTLRAHRFARTLPEDWPFRSAHRKLELLEAFGTGAFGAHPALIDCDAVVLAPLLLPDTDRLWLYDISEAMFGGGAQGAAARHARLAPMGAPAGARWYGGEFLAGPASGFAALAAALDALWPAYLALSHTALCGGDELPLSAAAARLEGQGVAIGEAGAAGLVARWWSRRTLQPGAPFAAARRAAVLHLPADKPYLAEAALRAFDPARFAQEYAAHAARRRRRERGALLAERLLGRAPQRLPQLV